MITGADIRTFRKQHGLTQAEFAERIGLSQSALSHLESGRIAVSDEHLDEISKKFQGRDGFGKYRDGILLRHGDDEARVPNVPRLVTVPVSRWEPGFELSRAPSPDPHDGMVTIADCDGRAIAVRFPHASPHWASGEIVVFEDAPPSRVDDGAVCLIVYRPRRSRRYRTVIAIARVMKPKATRFEQILPGSDRPAIPGDADMTVYQEIYRCKDLRNR